MNKQQEYKLFFIFIDSGEMDQYPSQKFIYLEAELHHPNLLQKQITDDRDNLIEQLSTFNCTPLINIIFAAMTGLSLQHRILAIATAMVVFVAYNIHSWHNPALHHHDICLHENAIHLHDAHEHCQLCDFVFIYELQRPSQLLLKVPDIIQRRAAFSEYSPVIHFPVQYQSARGPPLFVQI